MGGRVGGGGGGREGQRGLQKGGEGERLLRAMTGSPTSSQRPGLRRELSDTPHKSLSQLCSG